MSEDLKEIPINLMIDAVFNNFNDDTELIARWLFKNGYINKNKDGNYIINKKYKPTFFTTKEIKEYDYAFRYLQQENTQLKQQLKDKDEKISKVKEYEKIETPFCRDDNTKKLNESKWRNETIEYLKDIDWEFTEKID